MHNSYIDFVKDTTENCVKLVNEHYDFHKSILSIIKYFQKAISLAVDNTCTMLCKESTEWYKHEHHFIISCTDCDTNYKYIVALDKDVTSFNYSCNLSFTILDETDTIINLHTISASPVRKYSHPPNHYLDKMLKYIFDHTSESEKCYLYLSDSSIKDFFEFKDPCTIEVEFDGEAMRKLFGLR